MALRVQNAHFYDLKIDKFYNRGLNFEEEHEKTTVEGWYQGASPYEEEKIRREQAIKIKDREFVEF